MNAEERVSVTVDGQAVPLSDFVQQAISGMLRGFLGKLKGVGDPGQVSVTLCRGPACSGREPTRARARG
ncbi:MAG: hypothetical protein AB1758_04555 [Candidatus Eremiobacterota bacterium]